ncbi:peptide methionine sulfoxide reductase-like [Uloborus diversus]|uniref:peptide methionine sulfoxide reductase-like n=1 Tax=Uloborus diversus TaxID=327109 RepID=UPI002408F3F7|nr:peptide methionine sulfoxide reductase-like [Uloborus diversus]
MGTNLSAGSTLVARNMSETVNKNFKVATFAMGCFWHPDALFGCQKGVYRTRVGYTGGTMLNPTYRNLGDHTEAIDIDFNPEELSYDQLLKLFWINHDPTEMHKRQYRSVIFYRDEEQKEAAIKSKEEYQKLHRKPIVTAIELFNIFYNAENYHQKYYLQTHHKKLFNSLNIAEKNLIDSEVAAKLNGFVVGENTKEAFDEQCLSYKLSQESISYIYQMIKKGKQVHC